VATRCVAETAASEIGSSALPSARDGNQRQDDRAHQIGESSRRETLNLCLREPVS